MEGIEYLYYYQHLDGRLLATATARTPPPEGYSELSIAEYNRELKRIDNAVVDRRAAAVEERDSRRAAFAAKLGLDVADLDALGH